MKILQKTLLLLLLGSFFVASGMNISLLTGERVSTAPTTSQEKKIKEEAAPISAFEQVKALDDLWDEKILPPLGATAPVVLNRALRIAHKDEFEGHADVARGAQVSNDGTLAVSWSDDATACVWRLNTGERLHTLTHEKPLMSACFNHNGSQLFTATEDGIVHIWSLDSGTQVMIETGHQAYINTVCCDREGSLLLTGSADGTVRICDLESLQTGVVTCGSAVHSVVMSPDDNKILVACENFNAYIYDITTQALLTLSGHTASVHDAQFNHDGSQVITASNDHTVRIWDAQTGTQLRILDRHDDLVHTAHFNNDGSLVATACEDEKIRVFDATNGHLLSVMDAPLVLSARFAPTKKTEIISASYSGALAIWDVALVQKLLTYEQFNFVQKLHAYDLLVKKFGHRRLTLGSMRRDVTYDDAQKILNSFDPIVKRAVIKRFKIADANKPLDRNERLTAPTATARIQHAGVKRTVSESTIGDSLQEQKKVRTDPEPKK